MNCELQTKKLGNYFLDGTKGHVIFIGNKQTRLYNLKFSICPLDIRSVHITFDFQNRGQRRFLRMASLSTFNQNFMEV